MHPQPQRILKIESQVQAEVEFWRLRAKSSTFWVLAIWRRCILTLKFMIKRKLCGCRSAPSQIKIGRFDTRNCFSVQVQIKIASIIHRKSMSRIYLVVWLHLCRMTTWRCQFRKDSPRQWSSMILIMTTVRLGQMKNELAALSSNRASTRSSWSQGVWAISKVAEKYQ